MSVREASDDDAPEGLSFSAAAAAAFDEPIRASKKRARGLERLRIAPVPLSVEMLELLSQQQQQNSLAAVTLHAPLLDEDKETDEERRRRLRRQKRAKLAQQATREQNRTIMRQEVRCGRSF